MQVSNPSVARLWKLERNTSGQASRQASRQAPKASSLWKLKQSNITKKGSFFGPQNVRKSGRAKMGLPRRCLSVKSCVGEKLYERYDANYCLVHVIYCLDTTLLVCL